MPLLDSDIEKALDELISNEEGMRFQRFAVILAAQKWPDLVASERKWDLGADAIAPCAAADGRGKVLACSLTATLGKITRDAEKIKKHFPDTRILIFATTQRVTNQTAENWKAEIRRQFGFELVVMPREEIVLSLKQPSNATLCRSLGITVEIEPTVAELIAAVREAAGRVVAANTSRIDGSLINLRTLEVDRRGRDTDEIFHPDDIKAAIIRSERILLEAPAGCGKTTTLLQLARRLLEGWQGIPFLVELPFWARSHVHILGFIAGMPAFQARGLTTNMLARVLEVEPCCFLLNGWNEIAEIEMEATSERLRELDQTFPAGGIIVSTRTYDLVPPLSDPLRLRLLPVDRSERAGFLYGRLGEPAFQLLRQLEIDPVLDDLTRTPLFLSEIASIFEAGDPIPTTKLAVLDAVIRLSERAEQHKNYLKGPPLHGRARVYLSALAMEMTAQFGTTILDEDARRITRSVSQALREEGQIEALPASSAVLNALVGHHVLEMRDYPSTAFRFQHQQFQEFFAASSLDVRLREITQNPSEHGRHDFIATYINEPAWTESLRLVADQFALQTAECIADNGPRDAGRRLIEMAMTVDPVFAAELSRMCGPVIWNEVRSMVSTRLRSTYDAGGSKRRCALAGMLATGSAEFADIIVPLLSSNDQEDRLATYRGWRHFHLSTLGTDWHRVVAGWSEEARTDFCLELSDHGRSPEIAKFFATSDPSETVRRLALEELIWFAPEVADPILGDADDASFEAALSGIPPEYVPKKLRLRAMVGYRKLACASSDPFKRLQAILNAHELGERDCVIDMKVALAELPPSALRETGDHYLKPVLTAIRVEGPEWVRDWVIARILDGSLWSDQWISWVDGIPDDLRRTLLDRVESDDLTRARCPGLIPLVLVNADEKLANEIFSRLCVIRRRIAAVRDAPHPIEQTACWQLENLFRELPTNIAITGLSQRLATGIEPIEFAEVCSLFGTVGRPDSALRPDLTDELRQALRGYLLRGLEHILAAEDESAELKVNLASALSRVGDPEDLAPVRQIIQADLRRYRRNIAARLKGQRTTRGTANYVNWYVSAILMVDRTGDADRVLLDLLHEPEYECEASWGLVRLANTGKPIERHARRTDYDAIWEARAKGPSIYFDEERRARYALAIRSRVVALLAERSASSSQTTYDFRLKELAIVLAAIDGHQSIDLVTQVISLPAEWGIWQRIKALENLLFFGAELPASITANFIDPTLQRADRYDQQNVSAITAFLCLLPFVNDPSIGMAKIRQILGTMPHLGYELRQVAKALGDSRHPNALQLLKELVGSDPIRACVLGDGWINAAARLDTPDARRVLLSVLEDPNQDGLPPELTINIEHLLTARIVEAGQKDSAIYQMLVRMCENPVPSKRELLAEVMRRLGGAEAITAGLNLVEDTFTPAVPFGVQKMIEGICLEQRPTGHSNSYTLAPRRSNLIRSKLAEMAATDQRRRRAATELLARIEIWRLEYGRPNGEPRNPLFR